VVKKLKAKKLKAQGSKLKAKKLKAESSKVGD